MTDVPFFVLALAALLASVGFLGWLALAAAIAKTLLERTRPAELAPALHMSLSDPMPDTLTEWIERESEPWAKDQLRTEAWELRQRGNSDGSPVNWQNVELALKRAYGQVTDREAQAAAEAAWSSQEISS